MAWTLSRLAERVGAELFGDPAREIERIRALDEAGASDLSFLTHARYLEAARSSGAGALLVGRRHEELAADQLVVADPPRALAELLEWMHPVARPAPGIHASAVLGAGCEVDASAHVGAYAVLGDRCRIGAGAVLHPHVVLGEGCTVGERTVLHPHVVLYAGVELGLDCEVHAGTVLGADGFGYASGTHGHRKIPQVGRVTIGDRVEIGALSAVDRALVGATRVGAGTKIDNLVQVGHNVRIGSDAILCGQVGIAGSAKLGDGVVLGGQSGVGGHLSVGDGVQVASKSAVYDAVPAGEVVAGIPAVKIGRWRRQQSLLRRIDDLWRRLRALESRSAGEARRSDKEREES